MKWKSILIISVVTIILALFLVVRVQNNVPTAPYLFLNTLTAEKKQDRYIIRISQVGEEEKYVFFSEDREVLKTKGVTPLNPLIMEDVQTYIGMNFTDVIVQYGKPHTNIGSGFSIPAYITKDAYLISFQVEHDGVVVGVAKKDLLHSTGDGLGTGGRFSCLTSKTNGNSGKSEANSGSGKQPGADKSQDNSDDFAN